MKPALEAPIIVVFILSVTSCGLYDMYNKQVINEANVLLLEQRTQLLKTCVEKGIDINLCKENN
jgi:hypothetical protein